MSIISGEPDWFIMIIMEILEKMGLVPKPKELSGEELEEFKKMMEAKGFHFKEEEKG